MTAGNLPACAKVGGMGGGERVEETYGRISFMFFRLILGLRLIGET
jgi:hypothetical protein